VQVGTIQFHLLQSVTYSFCRDGIRRASLRASNGRSAAAFAWAASPFTVVCFSCIAGAFAFIPPQATVDTVASYRRGLVIYWVAFMLDSIWEPFLIHAVYEGQFGLEAFTDVCARVAEAAVMWMLVCLPQVWHVAITLIVSVHSIKLIAHPHCSSQCVLLVSKSTVTAS
jgi:Rft protein